MPQNGDNLWRTHPPVQRIIHEEVFLEDNAVLPMYAEDIVTVCTHRVNAMYLAKLRVYGPSFIYIPQPEKCVYICAACGKPTAREAESITVRYVSGVGYM